MSWSVDEVALLSIREFKVSVLVGERQDGETFIADSDENEYTQILPVEVRKS